MNTPRINENRNIQTMKKYVLIVSRTFPAKHPMKGEPTEFIEKILSNPNITLSDEIMRTPEFLNFTRRDYPLKLHTIRGNYELWRKRFDEIEAGKACLSVRCWTGKPYGSSQIEISRLTNRDKIGLQKVEFVPGIPLRISVPSIDGKPCNILEIARNDGLSLDNFVDWFKGYDLSKPMAIIHFTKFRYK